jgi:glycosyltransferase involved in cell wall biosynthesis
MKVVLFLRKPYPGQHSIERVYSSLLPFLANKVNFQVCIMPFESKGIVRRVLNAMYAGLKRGDVNHISGDINYIAVFLPKKGSILTVHDIYPVYTYKGLRKKIFEYLWFKLPISRVQQIIFISEFTCSEVVARYNVPRSKYITIANSVSPEFFYQQKIEQKNDPPILLQIGVKKNKNLLRVVEALAGFNCRLIIVGKPTPIQKAKMKRRGMIYDYFESVSNKELNDLYALSDLVLFVSTYEGFGLPIIEAQATGRPVLTSNVASMPEIAGRGALLVNPYSVEQIRKGVKKILKDEKFSAELVVLGQENIKRFNPRDIGEKYLRVYKKVASS